MQEGRPTHINDDGHDTNESVTQKSIDVSSHSGSSRLRVVVILPFHNEEENIKPVSVEILTGLEKFGYEPRLFLVNDGSTDNGLAVVREISRNDARVNYISLSRNFGKETALMAGIAECGDNFDFLAYMDSDGQHQVSDLLKLLNVCNDENTDLVCGVRVSRNYQSPMQRTMARGFYKIFRTLCDTSIAEGSGDFNVMKPVVVNAMRSITEGHPFVKGIIGWIGFRRTLVPIEIKERVDGTAKSSTLRMFKLAWSAILSFSSWPLKVWSVIGISFALISILYLILVILSTILFGRDVPGYATTIVLLLGIGGFQLMSIGIVGEYLARVYDASKSRPRYLISERS